MKCAHLQGALLITALGCFALSQTAQAIRLTPRGTYPGYNTAEGDRALQSLISGVWNTALGYQALYNDTTGSCNAATGNNALRLNTTGTDNTANGVQALANNTTGNFNIALGYCAGISLATGDKNIDIGNWGVAGESNTIRIGGTNWQTRTFIAGVRGVTTGNVNAIPVMIDSADQLGTVSSSVRFKKEIKPMDKASKAILALKPVTFQYKSDSTGTPQFGLIAEEVAAVDPNLVVRDEKGEIYTVRYEAVNAMLLNEFLKEHRKVQELEATATQQQQAIKALTANLKEQASKIQKVTTQLEVSKAAPQTVLNN
jgi:hypothetical protein